MDDEFSALKTKALTMLLKFPTSNLFETDFSAAAALKTKYKSLQNKEKELQECQFVMLNQPFKNFDLLDKSRKSLVIIKLILTLVFTN